MCVPTVYHKMLDVKLLRVGSSRGDDDDGNSTIATTIGDGDSSYSIFSSHPYYYQHNTNKSTSSSSSSRRRKKTGGNKHLSKHHRQSTATLFSSLVPITHHLMIMMNLIIFLILTKPSLSIEAAPTTAQQQESSVVLIRNRVVGGNDGTLAPCNTNNDDDNEETTLNVYIALTNPKTGKAYNVTNLKEEKGNRIIDENGDRIIKSNFFFAIHEPGVSSLSDDRDNFYVNNPNDLLLGYYKIFQTNDDDDHNEFVFLSETEEDDDDVYVVPFCVPKDVCFTISLSVQMFDVHLEYDKEENQQYKIPEGDVKFEYDGKIIPWSATIPPHYYPQVVNTVATNVGCDIECNPETEVLFEIETAISDDDYTYYDWFIIDSVTGENVFKCPPGNNKDTNHNAYPTSTRTIHSCYWFGRDYYNDKFCLPKKKDDDCDQQGFYTLVISVEKIWYYENESVAPDIVKAYYGNEQILSIDLKREGPFVTVDFGHNNATTMSLCREVGDNNPVVAAKKGSYCPGNDESLLEVFLGRQVNALYSPPGLIPFYPMTWTLTDVKNGEILTEKTMIPGDGMDRALIYHRQCVSKDMCIKFDLSMQTEIVEKLLKNFKRYNEDGPFQVVLDGMKYGLEREYSFCIDPKIENCYCIGDLMRYDEYILNGFKMNSVYARNCVFEDLMRYEEYLLNGFKMNSVYVGNCDKEDVCGGVNSDQSLLDFTITIGFTEPTGQCFRLSYVEDVTVNELHCSDWLAINETFRYITCFEPVDDETCTVMLEFRETGIENGSVVSVNNGISYFSKQDGPFCLDTNFSPRSQGICLPVSGNYSISAGSPSNTASLSERVISGIMIGAVLVGLLAYCRRSLGSVERKKNV